jgi:hypothetical protein
LQAKAAFEVQLVRSRRPSFVLGSGHQLNRWRRKNIVSVSLIATSPIAGDRCLHREP